MPSHVIWTAQYDTNKSPEANGFGRKVYSTPVVTEVTSGNPSQQRVEINSNNGSVVFLTSSVPSLNDVTGITIELVCRSGTPGNVGLQCTFLQRAVGLRIYADRIFVDAPGPVAEILTADNSQADISVWLSYADGFLNLYRNGLLIAGPLAVPAGSKPFQEVLWWGEEGGTQTVRALRYSIGGSFAPS
jgi:hypothetical protein